MRNATIAMSTDTLDTLDGRSKNRRVNIVIAPKLELE